MGDGRTNGGYRGFLNPGGQAIMHPPRTWRWKTDCPAPGSTLGPLSLRCYGEGPRATAWYERGYDKLYPFFARST
jgi:hypothetical protein